MLVLELLGNDDLSVTQSTQYFPEVLKMLYLLSKVCSLKQF